jgi:hypothetical protein
MIEAKALKYFSEYSLSKSEGLSAKIKLTLHKALIRTVITYACPAWGLAAVLTKQVSALHCIFYKVHTSPRYAHRI